MILAVTGGTGFVGARLLDQALAAGHQVRALTRRAQPIRAGVTWIEGALDRPDSLTALVVGAEAVVHVAGVVNAPDRAGFTAGNVEGTRAMLTAAERAGVARFVHVSSLAAREPGLSLYGASKAEAEALVEASALAWSIVRPPAVFGPGDLEMLDVFRLARRGLALLPSSGRLSVIAVEDLAALLLALATAPAVPRAVVEADDGSAGWTHDGFARAIGQAVGRRVKTFALPAPALRLGVALDSLLRGRRAKLTRDRVAYLRHPDWTIDPARRPPASLWHPTRPTDEALAATARWYRAHRLL